MSKQNSIRSRKYFFRHTKIGAFEHRTQIHQILNELKEEKKILSYKCLYSAKSAKNLESFAFLINYKENYFLKYVIQQNKSQNSREDLITVVSRSREVVVKITEQCPPRALKKNLTESIASLKDGYGREERYIQTLSKLINSDREVSKMILAVRGATEYEDKDCGVDCVIIMRKGSDVPMQIKASVEAQMEHRRKFPNVPSFVLGDYTSYEKIKQCTILMCKSYQVGHILHY